MIKKYLIEILQLWKGFILTDRMISQKVEESSGSTALAILIDSENIYCANIGDSRAVSSFSGHTCPLSFDHKPNRTDELKRVEVYVLSHYLI